jgi:hypothetical protein
MGYFKGGREWRHKGRVIIFLFGCSFKNQNNLVKLQTREK